MPATNLTARDMKREEKFSRQLAKANSIDQLKTNEVILLPTCIGRRTSRIRIAKIIQVEDSGCITFVEERKQNMFHLWREGTYKSRM